MENKRLSDRGTVAVGALAIIAVFMIAVTCFTALIAEYNRYVYTVKTVSQKLLMKGQEKLIVERIPGGKIEVRNEGSTTSFIIGVFAVNPRDNNVKYVRFDAPETVKILSTEEISLPPSVPSSREWKISVLTAYGNIFWEES